MGGEEKKESRMLQKFWLKQLKGWSCSLEIRKATQSEEFWGGRSGFTFGNQVQVSIRPPSGEIVESAGIWISMGLYLGIEVCIWKSLALYQQRCEYRLRKEGKD